MHSNPHQAKWARDKYKGIVNTHRVQSTSHQEDWVKRGRCVSFLKMLELEGGPTGHSDEETIRNCTTHCIKCIEMGHPFVQVDAFHKGVQFLHFEMGYNERFTETWTDVVQGKLLVEGLG